MRVGLLLVPLVLLAGVLLRECQRTRITEVPAELGPLVASLNEAREDNNAAMLERIGRSLVPSSDELRQVLRPGAASEAYIQSNGVRDLRPGAPGDRMAIAFARAILRGMTGERGFTIHTAHALTEELAEGPGKADPAQGGGPPRAPAFTEADRVFARSVAAPGRSWHVVEIRDETGQQRLGAPLRLLTRLGGRWIYLAMPSRAGAPSAQASDTDAPK